MKDIFRKIFWQIDIIYLAVVSLASQFLLIPEIFRLLLSLPYFLIVPIQLGSFILSITKRDQSVASRDPFLGFAVNWCLGAISLFFLALILQVLHLFNVYVFLLVVICILVYTKIKSGEKLKPELHMILKRIDTALGDYRIVILSLLIGLIPILLIYPHWPFPLKIDSDSFEFSMLTTRITENNLIDLFSAFHPPIGPVLLSIPSLLFNVIPFDFYWGLPLIVYPLISFVAYLFSYKISGNKFLSLFASIIIVGACGDGTAVHPYLVHPQDIVGFLLFPIATLLILETMDTNEEHGFNTHANIIQTISFLLLSYSTLEASLSPAINHLPQIFLALIVIVFLFLFFEDILGHRVKNVTTYLLIPILVFFIIYFVLFFRSDIDYPNILSWGFFLTILGVSSAISLIFSLKSSLNTTTKGFNKGFAVVSLGTLLFHQQLGILMVIALVALAVVYHFAQNRSLIKLVWLFIAFILFLIILEKIGVVSVFSSLSSIGNPSAPSFNQNFSLLEEVFTVPILILFLSGAFFSLVYRRVKETYILLVGCVFSLFYFLPIAVNYRVIIFLTPIVAYFAANTLRTWNSLLPDINALQIRTRKLSRIKSKAIVKFRESHIFFLVVLLIFLPTITQPYTTFIDYTLSHSHPFYTFDQHEYDVAQWIHKHTPEDVIVISDPFTQLVVCGLSNRGVTLNQRMIYDAKGNTHAISRDYMIMNKTKELFLTSNVTMAINDTLEIRETYVNSKQLNEKMGASFMNGSSPIIIIMSGRTTRWIKSNDFSDIVFPSGFEFLPGYEKFFKHSAFVLLYENSEEIFVFGIEGSQ